MRRFLALGLSLGMVYVILAGCTRQADNKNGNEGPAPIALAPGGTEPTLAPAPNPGRLDPTASVIPIVFGNGDDKQEKYEAALTEALTHLSEQKYADALAALETARSFQDNDFIKGEIEKVKARLDQDSAARKTVDEIASVLDDGKGAEAAKLAQAALKEFGGGDSAGQLVRLRLQADALQNVQSKEEDNARFQRLRDEGEAALKEKNFRAAAIAYEQALTLRQDAGLKDQLADLRTNLEKYDSLRQKAAALRPDPSQLEEAVAALKDAAKAWDTLQVRQEIDEYTLALEKRRDNVSVADFEVRGDVGIPEAGKAIADELLPTLKPRYDLVERAQIARVLGELKFEHDALDDPQSQREFAKIAKVRYLVLGSVQRLGAISVNARLVDVRTGLVVQTAKIVAASAEDLLTLLPDLGKQLLMSDEEKLVFEERQAKEAKQPAPVADDAPLPPPPAAPQADMPPLPPPMVEAVAPPVAGGLRVDAFQNLPAPPPPGQEIVLPPAGAEVDVRVRHRLLYAVLHLGDDLFRRGRFREAHRHFEFALTLAPANFDLQLRLDRVRPLLPPPPVVIVERPVIVVRPRIAIVNFLTWGDPRTVPPVLGPWTAYNIAPYFNPYFDVVDQNEVYWYMGQMGLTLRDLMENPIARRWLGRALGVRYFLLGTIQETGSFDVTTYLLDAEFGYLQGSGTIRHVRNPFELKLRLGELAQLTTMEPGQRVIYLRAADEFADLVVRGQDATRRGEFQIAIDLFGRALRLRPGHIEVLGYLERTRRLERVAILSVERRGLFIGVAMYDPEAARRRAWELAQAAELARIRAAQEAAARAEAERALLLEQRRRAQGVLLVQARFAVQTKNFGIAVNFFNGAAAVAPPRDDILREFAQARVEADRASRLRAAEQTAVREAALRIEREKELAIAQERLANERKLAQVTLAAQRKIQEERDKAAAQSAFDEGQRQLAKGNYDAAIASLQLARRLGKGGAVEPLLAQAVERQTLETAKAKGETEHLELERKLALERERRKLAEKEAKRNQELYQAALELANKALAQKEYDIAQAKYQEAGRLFRTDAVLSGLKQIETARAGALADIEAARQKTAAEQDKTARLQKLLLAGQAAGAAKKHEEAVAQLQQAKKIAPDNVEVMAALTRAEQERDKDLAEARRKGADAERQKTFQRLLKSGQDNFAAKHYDAAIAALGEALKLNPDDATTRVVLQKATAARDATLTDAKAKEEARKKTEAYQKLLGDGRLALSTKRFDDAINAFNQAQKILPGDKTSADLLQDAQAGKKAAQLVIAEKRAEEQKTKERAAKVRDLVASARTALQAKKLDIAAKALADAKELAPTDAAVNQALTDLERARASAANEGQKLAGFQKALQAGQAAFEAKKYAEAVKSLQEATSLMPGDAKARQLLEQAQTALTTSTDLAKKQASFAEFINAGQKALTAKKFAEAQKAYSAALKLFPGDPAATRGLEAAQRGPDTPTTKDPVPGVKEKFQKEMQNAAALEKAQKYEAAWKSYQVALKLVPDDTKAKEGARRNEFYFHYVEGQKHLDAKRFPEAIREFETALTIIPNEPTATKLLQKAKQGKKSAGHALRF